MKGWSGPSVDGLLVARLSETIAFRPAIIYAASYVTYVTSM